jgi:hypothetical protein
MSTILHSLSLPCYSLLTHVPWQDCVLFTMFYCFCIVFLKISLAFFYLRIVIQKWQRALLYVTCTAMTIYGLAYAFIYMFRCGIDTNHQLMAREQNKCLSDQTLLVMMYAFGILDTITDFVYAGIPVYVLWGSNMPIGLKLTAGILLTMGSASCVCALIRVATLSRLTFGPEFFTQAVQTGLWSIIEPGLALVAASIAACKPLWRQISRSRSSKRSGISSSQSQNDKILSRPSGLTFSERTEANRGFTKFDGDDYGISITTVKAGEGGQMMELQDLGGLEAQDDFREEDRSIKSLIRASVGSSEHRGKSKIFQTRDVWVDVKEGRPAHRGVSL